MAKRHTDSTSVSYWGIIKKTFKERFLVAMFLIAVLFVSIQYLPDIGLFCVLQVIIVISLLEFYNLFKGSDDAPYVLFGLAISFLIGASFVFEGLSLAIALLISLFLVAVRPLLFPKTTGSLSPYAHAFSLTLAGPLLVSLTLNHVYLLRMEWGAYYVYFLLIVVIFGDTASYFVGKFWGKHAMAPKASPRKTWEGAFGGIVFAGVGALCVRQVLIHDILLWKALLVGVLVHVFAQIGDLLESLFKRSSGHKDSSNLLGGHGGFLDRIDSFVLSAPFFYYTLTFFRLN